MESFFSRSHEQQGQKAKDKLKKNFGKRGVLHPEVSEEQIKSLPEDTGGKLYEIKTQIKHELEPDLKDYLRQDLGFFWKRLVDPKRFYQEACEALNTRGEASSFIETGTIDQNPEEFIKKLERVRITLKGYLDQLKGSEIGIEEIRRRMDNELNDFKSTKQLFGIYSQIMSDNDKAEFEKNRKSAEKYSTRFSAIKSSSQEDQALKQAKAFVKFREANIKLSEIIEKQKASGKLQKGLVDQLASANPYSQEYAQALSLVKEGVNQDNLPGAIRAFEELAVANKESSQASSGKGKQVEYYQKDDNLTVEEGKKSKNIQSKFDHSIGYEIYRAKKGLERFKRSYENESREWKKLLTSKTDEGESLRAMYLGLTPMIYGLGKQSISLYKQYAEGDFHIE